MTCSIDSDSSMGMPLVHNLQMGPIWRNQVYCYASSWDCEAHSCFYYSLIYLSCRTVLGCEQKIWFIYA